MPTLPDGWQHSPAGEIACFRHLIEKGSLQICFQSHPDRVYDFPCDAQLWRRFRSAPEQYTFVQDVLRPHAEKMGWTELARAHRGSSPAPQDQ
jgi:hypothetical protein